MLRCKKHPTSPMPDRCLTCAIARRENQANVIRALKCAVEWLDNVYNQNPADMLYKAMPNNCPSRSTMREIIEYAEKQIQSST